MYKKRCVDSCPFIVPIKIRLYDMDVEGKTLVFIVDSQCFTWSFIITATFSSETSSFVLHNASVTAPPSGWYVHRVG